jgi:Glycogen recognition site of AMP-activated protein kinase
MGNQHSAPDKDKEREKENEKDKERDRDRDREPHRAASRHEKHRSRTIAPTPALPPTETKVNAEQTHNANTKATTTTVSTTNSIPLSSNSVESPTSNGHVPPQPQPTESIPSTSLKEWPMPRTSVMPKEVVDSVKNMNLVDLPRPTEEEIRKEGTETEPTPIFETMKVPSETSLVDEDELKEADKSDISLTRENQPTVESEKVPLVLDWNEGGKKVAVVGTFTGWRKRVNLRKS